MPYKFIAMKIWKNPKKKKKNELRAWKWRNATLGVKTTQLWIVLLPAHLCRPYRGKHDSFPEIPLYYFKKRQVTDSTALPDKCAAPNSPRHLISHRQHNQISSVRFTQPRYIRKVGVANFLSFSASSPYSYLCFPVSSSSSNSDLVHALFLWLL